jgi:choline dehydrogenase-like flavoprotein
LKNNRVIIIGSGLSAYAAVLAALEYNCHITLLDVGERLPDNLSEEISNLKNVNSAEVNAKLMNLKKKENQKSLLNKKMPQKTVFGSKYFYKEFQLDDGNLLPYTEALGGYSVAWGAAVLPPDERDLANYPIEFKYLEESLNFIASKISMPHLEDSLTAFFPNFGNYSTSIKLSPSQEKLLSKVSKLNKVTESSICISGQARIATKADGDRACRYCGMCSNGCVYNSIFSAEKAISHLVSIGSVAYISRKWVFNICEDAKNVKVQAINSEGKLEEFPADFVFVAAGAVNSTKIAHAMKKSKEKIILNKTGGFVRPYFSFRKNGFDWPIQNTQSNIFLEIRNTKISEYWIHSQISTPNEIVIYGLRFFGRNFFSLLISPLRRFLLNHLVIVMTNLHSNEGPFYELDLNEEIDTPRLRGKLVVTKNCKKLEAKIDRYLKIRFLSLGMLALPFTKKGISSGPGYHLGGSLPMGGSSALSTDSLGRLAGSRNVHFVDTSVLPSIPATTIGFLTMANAHRIVKGRLSIENFEQI